MQTRDKVVIPAHLSPDSGVIQKVAGFLDHFSIYEVNHGSKAVLYRDERSTTYYLICHLDARTLMANCDLEASLEANEDDEIYKLNRDITEDEVAYKVMEEDALKGRSFEDLVVEYDTSYRRERPLKVYGGQHRIRAITKAGSQKGSVVHGVRVYFDLSRKQKVEIATVNNTSIAVPNDLLDRMREQLLGSELRDWCQSVGLLEKGHDFADRKSPSTPTVRIARTLLVNFYLGMESPDDGFRRPIVCKSGGMDDTYHKTRAKVDWSDDRLAEMGRQFARLHQLQEEIVTNRDRDSHAEFARKALSLTVVAGWAYASGLFQKDEGSLRNHYSLPDSVSPPNDPLNAKAMSQARLKGIDPDTYRGLGTRTSAGELGRMLEVFIIQAKKAKGITKELANAAIKSYEAKKATHEADKAIGRI